MNSDDEYCIDCWEEAFIERITYLDRYDCFEGNTVSKQEFDEIIQHVNMVRLEAIEMNEYLQSLKG